MIRQNNYFCFRLIETGVIEEHLLRKQKLEEMKTQVKIVQQQGQTLVNTHIWQEGENGHKYCGQGSRKETSEDIDCVTEEREGSSASHSRVSNAA